MKVTIGFKSARGEARAKELLAKGSYYPTEWVDGGMVYDEGEFGVARALEAIEILVRQGIGFTVSTTRR